MAQMLFFLVFYQTMFSQMLVNAVRTFVTNNETCCTFLEANTPLNSWLQAVLEGDRLPAVAQVDLRAHILIPSDNVASGTCPLF